MGDLVGGIILNGYPTMSAVSLAQLVASIVAATIRRTGDRREALHDWIRREADRHGTDAFVVNLLGKKILLVHGSALSAFVLDSEPDANGFVAGPTKWKGMAFVAPHALTISHGADWQRRRAINEQVLSTGRPHDLRTVFHAHVRASFAAPITSADDVRDRMGRVMLDVVLGGDAPDDLPGEIDELMTYVYNPAKRILLGRFAAQRKRSLYDTLRHRWEDRKPDCLMASLQETGAEPEPENLEQIPHWMFTFTGSGADLLARTLALIGSRPEVRDEVAREIEQAGPLDDVATIDSLDYIEACLRETGRLFAPVTRTFHRTPHGATFHSRNIPPEVEVVHYFPVGQRDTEIDPTANDFRPERWMGASDAADRFPSPFMSGSRRCPAEDLILFLCKGAIASQQGHHVYAPSLVTDPLPVSYPEREVRHLANDGSSHADPPIHHQGGTI